jgi:outer membrane protein assembly factor BamB
VLVTTCRALVLAGTVAALAAMPAGGSPQANEGCAVAEWPQPRQSSCGAGSSADPDSPSPDDVGGLVPAWTARFDTALGNPIVSGGRVFVVSGAPRPRLNAVDLASGRLRWRAISGVDGGLAPIADGDVLLRMSAVNVLRRYDPRSGRIFWRRNVIGSPEGPGTQQVVADGRWYQSKGEELVAFGARRGEPAWRIGLSCFGCRVAAAGGRVYAAGSTRLDDPDDPGALRAFDGATGDQIWAARGEGGFTAGSSPLLVDGTLYVVTTDTRPASPGNTRRYVTTYFAEAFRASDGKPLWHTPLGSARAISFHLAAAGPGLVVYQTVDGVLRALDAGSGKPRWQARVESESRPAIGNGIVWIVDRTDRLIALDASDGLALWRSRRIKGLSASSPVLAGGHVLLGSRGGQLLAWHVANES